MERWNELDSSGEGLRYCVVISTMMSTVKARKSFWECAPGSPWPPNTDQNYHSIFLLTQPSLYQNSERAALLQTKIKLNWKQKKHLELEKVPRHGNQLHLLLIRI